MTDQPGSAPTDYDKLMRANLAHVFNERDAVRRMAAIGELYAADAVLFDPEGVAKGHAAISEAVTALLAQLPPSFVFSATGTAVGHHEVARLHWRSGPAEGPVAVTGTDVAHFENGRIRSLHVFLDPATR
ncbi:MAG TPA: nuclear transport factor 2 family protein [Tepidisphaeraceae bacterium]|nr:nuclear transport factor 2 family protein [Tepidisphaeraceae bacterium]